MKPDNAVLALAALANESRLAIFRLLVKRGPEGHTPGDLQQKLDISAPTLSFHLRELQRAGLVTSSREGRFLYYCAEFTRMQALLSFLTEKCCTLADQACDSDCRPVAEPAKRARSARS